MATKLPTVVKVSEEYGAQVIAEAKTRLLGFGRRATGNLYNSLDYDVKETTKGVQLQFFAEDYLINVDQGRGAGKKQPPLDKIRDWCRIKNIPVEAAFPIARAIGRRGIPATYFWTTTINRRQKQFESKIQAAFAADTEKTLATVLKAKKK